MNLLWGFAGTRLSVSAAHDIITTIAHTARLHDTTAHVLRHTFATRLVRGGTDLMIVAELLGHTRLETTRLYGARLPSRKHAIKALELLDINHGPMPALIFRARTYF